jgi:hypothetical protein
MTGLASRALPPSESATAPPGRIRADSAPRCVGHTPTKLQRSFRSPWPWTMRSPSSFCEVRVLFLHPFKIFCPFDHCFFHIRSIEI